MTRKEETVHICLFLFVSMRILDIPPVKEAQAGQIIRHRISAFYPGDADDLYIDFIKDGEKTLVFYAGKDKIDRLREEEGNCSLYSLWHLFSGIREKTGVLRGSP